MANWNNNIVPKCKERTCSDEVLVTVERRKRKAVLKAVYIPHHHLYCRRYGMEHV